MKMLVTKFSNGKYANEAQLFDEVISDDNVKLMGEMVALQVLRNAIPFDFEVVEKLYNGLVKDLHHLNENRYIISDGYDYAQTAICFLLQFKGKRAFDIYSIDRNGKEITIKNACYREVDRKLCHYRKRIARCRFIELNHNKHDIPDHRDCFEDKEADFDKADSILNAMRLTDMELNVLNCYMNKMKLSEVCAELGMTHDAVKYRKMRIRQKYALYAGV